MKFFRWEDGRQESDYSKMLLAQSKRFRFDFYLICIPDGCGVPPHQDPAVEGFEHHRINFLVNRPLIGKGEIVVKGKATKFFFGRGIYFRPDENEHWMAPVKMASSDEAVYLLSFGWLRKKVIVPPANDQ